jgi:hypothetical protein
MKWYHLLPVILVILYFTLGSTVDVFLSKDFVDLRGRESLTIIKNSTSDTLQLQGSFFNDLPYSENRFMLSIPPGGQDTIKLFFTYPDFIYVESPEYFRLFNIPGKVVHCEMLDLTSRAVRIRFQGELAGINDYYLSYHNQFGSSMENNRPYFQLADQLKNFDMFPAKADSISGLSLTFLRKFPGDLPSWFRKHEEWRLKYLAGFLKHNVLLTKEFYSGENIKVSPDYFSFEEHLPFDNNEMILNNQYLWYVRSFLGREKKPRPSEVQFFCH